MSNITGDYVRNLRIGVEPVEVEFDDDSGILWTSLQTAFPGCSGMYYREKGDDCKKSVRFDGKKFLAPGGAWNDRDYYVTLSQRCHAANATNGSNYSEATKQFEKSVQAVQKMMLASGMKIDMSHLTKKRHTKSSQETETASSTSSDTTIVVDPIQAIQERSEMLKSAKRELSPLEQQFLDLCRISTAKDQIIDSNRQEISKLNESIRIYEKDLKELDGKLHEANGTIQSRDEELEILRNFGTQFQKSRDTVDELTQKSSGLEENLTELQLKLMSLEEENESLRAQLETSSNQIKEMNENIQVITASKELLSTELNQLRPFADASAIEDFENIPTFIYTMQENKKLHKEMETLRKSSDETRGAFDDLQIVQKPLFEENEKLRRRTEDLERRFEHVDEELKCLNENWAKELRDKQEDWAVVKEQAESEVYSLREQLSHLQSVLESATREAAENARRSADPLTSYSLF